MGSLNSILVPISNLNSKVIVACKRRLKRAGSLDTPRVGSECSTTSPNDLSPWARSASDIAQVTLPVIQGAADTIPLAGAPLKVAISGLLVALQMIDTRIQNISDLEELMSTGRLYLLTVNISKAPAPRSDAEVHLRECLRGRLEQTSHQLKDLAQAKRFAYKSATNILAGYSKDIDHCLLQYAVLSRMHDHDRQEELLSVTSRSASAITELRALILQESSKFQSTLESQMLDHAPFDDVADQEHTITIDTSASSI